MTSRPAPLPHEPVTYRWHLAVAAKPSVFEWDWGPDETQQMPTLLCAGDALHVRLANGQLVTVRRKS